MPPNNVPRNVIVTGGSRGLGLGIARELREAGYRVIVVARSPTDEVRDFAFVPCDLANTAAIPELVSGIRKEFGPIYGLVNNAGLGTSGVLATMPDAEIGRLVQLNTVAPMVLAKYAVRSMMAQGGGRIVNIGSIVGQTGYSGLSVYSATKASLIGFTKSLAREVGKLGITVNAVAPGFIATEMTHSLDEHQRSQIARRSALNRLAEIDDVAHAVAYLMSDKARNITGAVMTVDAGNTA
ncbi:MAG TPA: SDR family oxidoreductase [Stellaceae bacterium]|nr:SDR family oxidoreductase [Stellaceae bacterium]